VPPAFLLCENESNQTENTLKNKLNASVLVYIIFYYTTQVFLGAAAQAKNAEGHRADAIATEAKG